MSDPGSKEAAIRPVWALIPVKSFERGKSRLSVVLGASQRVAFARSLLQHVLEVLAECRQIQGTMVATDGPDVAAFAEEKGAVVLRDEGPLPLHAVVDRALRELSVRAARSALVLMSDLPLVQPRDVLGLIEIMRRADVVVVPDFYEEGTNALGLTVPGGFPTCFGARDSFRRHCDRALERGFRMEVYTSEALMFDVDGPEDWERLQGRKERRSS